MNSNLRKFTLLKCKLGSDIITAIFLLLILALMKSSELEIIKLNADNTSLEKYVVSEIVSIIKYINLIFSLILTVKIQIS